MVSKIKDYEFQAQCVEYLIDNTDDCACAIFRLSGITEMGNDLRRIANAFDANIARVEVLLSYVLAVRDGLITGENGEN